MSGSTPSGRRARQGWRWRCLVPVLAAVVGVVIFEAGLQVADWWDAKESLHLPDGVRGWRLRPGFEGWIRDEGAVWVRINSDGLRDREHPLVAGPGTVRVALLGDSYMQATNVAQEHTFAARLESRLIGCPAPAGGRAEVLNFGVNGYSTAQQLLTFRSHVAKYSPEVVILALYTGNDIFNNHPELNESRDLPTPYFSLRGDELVLHPPVAIDEFADEPWFRRLRIAITERVATANLLYRGWDVVRPDPPVADIRPEPAIAGGLGSGEIYRPPTTPQIAEAWRLTEAMLLALAREVAAAGAEFWIVTLSNAEQVHPDPAARQAFAERLGVADLFYPDRRIRDFAAANAIPVVTLVAPLADYGARHGQFLNGGTSPETPPGTGHWNVTANALAAGIVADRLCADSGPFASPLDR